MMEKAVFGIERLMDYQFTLICGNGKLDLQKNSEAEIVSEESDAALEFFYFVGFFNCFYKKIFHHIVKMYGQKIEIVTLLYQMWYTVKEVVDQ